MRTLDGAGNYLRTVLDNVHDAIFIHNLKGDVVDVNEKLLEMYKVSREEAIRLTIKDGYSAPDNPIDDLPSLWQKTIAGENQFFEWKAKRPKDSSVFDVEVFLTKLSLPDGDFILANVRDITERKLVEQELHVTRDYLRTVFNNVYDAIFVTDINGKVIDVNDKMLEMYRLSREEAIQLHIIPDYSTAEHTFDKLFSLFTKVLAGENQFFEWKAKRPKDSSVFDVEVFLTKLSLPDGDFILANVRDITERKAMEKLLIKEKEVFFSVMNNNPHGIALLDRDNRFIYFNPEFTTITGYTLEDVTTGRDWARRAYPDREYRRKVAEVWKADRFPEGRGKDVEFTITCKNGQRKDVEFRVTYLDDRSLVVLTDTTLRNRAEEELRAEKQRFQMLSESSPVGMVMIGEDGTFKYANPKFKELFGYTLKDVPNTSEWFLRVYPDPFYRHEAASKWTGDLKTLKPGEWRPYMRKVKCRDSTQKHINFIPVRLHTGEILMTCEDITQNKEAEDKIKQRNLELEVFNDIISSVRGSLHLPEILETLKKVFMEKLEILTGGIFFYDKLSDRTNMEMSWGVSDAMVDDFEAMALKTFNSMLGHDHEATPAKSHFNYLQSSGSLGFRFGFRWLIFLSIPLLVEGEIHGMIFLIDKEGGRFHDDHMSFFKTLGQQIGVAIQNARLFDQVQQSHGHMKALSRRLVEVQEAERRNIARELHDEIGQVLTGLKLTLEMNALQARGKIKAGLMEAKTIVNTLVALVRELSLNLRPAMLDDLGLLPTLPWHFERFTNQTQVKVEFRYTGLTRKRLPIELETAIYRIVQEALTNVARHAKVSEVVVRLWLNKEIIGVQIEDFGTGFDLDAVLNAPNTSGLRGMRERAALLGGQLTVESCPGSGTCLSAEFPFQTQPAIMNIINIVLADNHHIVRQGVKALLESQPDFAVIGEARDGLKAVDLVVRLKPQVLVADLMMPGLNGLEVVRQVTKLSPATKVIILSMYMNEPYVIEALRNGAYGYVLKESNISDLVHAIHEVNQGRHYLGPPLSERAMEAYLEKTRDTSLDVYDTLSTREREVLHLVVAGYSNAEIAVRLFISSRTAETHRANMMRKLSLHTQTDLIKYALKKGIIPKED